MAADRSTAQTLSRGLRVLELLAESDTPMTANDLAEALGTSRPIVYRLLRTLDAHGLLDPDVADGRFGLGLGLLTLSRKVVRDLREAAIPELTALTRAFHATSFIVVRDRDEVVCVASVEPGPAYIAIRHREGMRLPMTGASGQAILLTEPVSPEDEPDLVAARADGFASSRGRLMSGALGVAVPIRRDDGPAHESVAIVFAQQEGVDVEQVAAELTQTADRIARSQTM